ncbi:gamma carbonic anhydrase family protein [Petropleomorpha daqingensis]|uniref:Carbonic anhydrase/acetyltransferase-like protein (Isoleucine patch superfamily) n=1 Tax=Petropleomorpha daqingensis TaxID=2026353 RepID=A0A853CAK7_9ACTN|nr:gamma carbonic anhydrase family protein [Petropleomorpha daqingensis]NYJ04940.1 carbonic anhydrase/acetyltransferase-like protein (isoleucine patch superfamily) [Petropleomorpha daqingensis]
MVVPEPYLHPPGRGAMFVVHRNGRPTVDESVYVAPTAVVSGDVTIGPHSRVLYGAVLTAEGGPVVIGANCIVMENAVVRGVPRHPTRLGDNVLVGPHAHLTGCTVDGDARIATGAMLYNGAHLERGADVEVGAVVHVNTRVPVGVVVPMGWFAGGDPVELVPPGDRDRIRALMGPLDYPGTVFGVSPEPGESAMPDIARRYTRALALHRYDVLTEPAPHAVLGTDWDDAGTPSPAAG